MICITRSVLVAGAIAACAGIANGSVLSIQGNYTGLINGQPLVGFAAGVLDTSGDGDNHVQIDFINYPDGAHPYAYGNSKTTIFCWSGGKAIDGAANLFDLSGGNYTVDRVFSWPSLPGSGVTASGQVSTVGDQMLFDCQMNGTYAGPTDLVSVSSYSVVWEQFDATTVHEKGIGEILRADGTSLIVNVESYYKNLSSMMPVPVEYGVMTKRDLTWDGSTYTLNWAGYLTVPAPAGSLAFGALAGIASRRRRA